MYTITELPLVVRGGTLPCDPPVRSPQVYTKQCYKIKVLLAEHSPNTLIINCLIIKSLLHSTLESIILKASSLLGTSHQTPNFHPNYYYYYYYYILLYRDLHTEHKVQQKKIDLLIVCIRQWWVM